MKVKIGNYPNRWVSTLHSKHMEKKYGFLWEVDGKPVVPTRLDNLIEEVEDTIQLVYDWTANIFIDRFVQRVNIHIDPWDTWSMDHTLAPIILPMLKQLKETSHGYPGNLTEDKWNNILDEMIWAFEQKMKDHWEGEYYRFEDDPSATLGCKIVWQDDKGREAHQERMTNGFKLFGIYFENLWD